jgi:hypothetical protein
MSLYRFKIKNNNKFITGGTINPMINTGHTGNQKFTEYLNINYKLGPSRSVFPANTKSLRTPTSGDESDLNYTNNAIVKLDYELYPLLNQRNKDNFKNRKITISSGQTINKAYNYKNIIIPINTSFEVVDYGDEIKNFVKEEEKKSINKIVDYERIKYLSIPYPGLNLKFRFFNKDTAQYDDNTLTGGYNLAGFDDDEINIKSNFKKSFFRLYFLDSNDTRNQNLLLTEEIDVFGSKKPQFNFGRIFWLKNDELFSNSFDNRIVYMEARFFNAKTGRVHRFMNPPDGSNSLISIDGIKNNQEWKTSQLLIYNPKNTNGFYQFRAVNGIGANTQNTITMTEYILET